MENELTCCVCLDLYTEPLMLPCSHNFCKKCLWDLYHHSQGIERDEPFRRQINCPKCRREVDLECLDPWQGINNIPANKALDNVVRVYKNSSQNRTEEKPPRKKCITHVKPLSLYCQTCKLALCEDCVLQAHSGFGHGVKEIDDFIQEEKDKARASFQEVDALAKNITIVDAETTTHIVSSKAREMDLKKTLEDEFEVVRRYIESQRAKALDDVTMQLFKSRTNLEVLSKTCTTLKAEIRILRNSHRDALQETNPDRQLKLLQELTLSLSTFLTFKGTNFLAVPEPCAEQSGCLENLEKVLTDIRKLNWTNSSKQTGASKTVECATQTWDQKAHRNPFRPRPRQIIPEQRTSDNADKAPALEEGMTLKDLLSNASRELQELTGRPERPSRSLSLNDTVDQLEKLRLDQELETIENNGEDAKKEQPESGACGGCDNSHCENGNGVSAITHTQNNSVNGGSASNVLSAGPSRSPFVEGKQEPRLRDFPTSWNGEKPTLFPNGIKKVLESGESFWPTGNTFEGYKFFGPQPCWVPDGKRWAPPPSEPGTLKLYFDKTKSTVPNEESTLSSQDATATTSAAVSITTNQTQEACDEAKPENHSSRDTNGPSDIVSNGDVQSASAASETIPETSRPEVQGAQGGSFSSCSLLSLSPGSDASQSQCCGVGARPKVRSSNQRSAKYGRSLSGGCLDSKDSRRMGASFKEGLNSAVCTIKSLCRSGFSVANNKDLDVNANDNGVEGSAKGRSFDRTAFSHTADRHQPVPRRSTTRRSYEDSSVSEADSQKIESDLSSFQVIPSVGIGAGAKPSLKPGFGVAQTSTTSSLGDAPLSSSWPSARPPIKQPNDQGTSDTLIPGTDMSKKDSLKWPPPGKKKLSLSESLFLNEWPTIGKFDSSGFTASTVNDSETDVITSAGTSSSCEAAPSSSSGMSFQNLSFDFVMSAGSPKKDATGSPRLKQRRYQKNKKRAHQKK